MAFQDVGAKDKSWLWSKLTHEEIFELAFINVMWKVADEELVAVRVTDDPPALHVARLVLTSATYGRQQQLKGSDHQTFLNCIKKQQQQVNKNDQEPQNETFAMRGDWIVSL